MRNLRFGMAAKVFAKGGLAESHGVRLQQPVEARRPCCASSYRLKKIFFIVAPFLLFNTTSALSLRFRRRAEACSV